MTKGPFPHCQFSGFFLWLLDKLPCPSFSLSRLRRKSPQDEEEGTEEVRREPEVFSSVQVFGLEEDNLLILGVDHDTGRLWSR